MHRRAGITLLAIGLGACQTVTVGQVPASMLTPAPLFGPVIGAEVIGGRTDDGGEAVWLLAGGSAVVRVDLDARRAYVADLVERVAAAADDGRQAMEQRIADRVRELRAELQADENAVAQEIVRMAARSDISEEVERFRAHVSHWAALADSTEPCGR